MGFDCNLSVYCSIFVYFFALQNLVQLCGKMLIVASYVCPLSWKREIRGGCKKIM